MSRRPSRFATCLLLVTGILLGSATARGQSSDRLVVGTKEAPPFAMKGEDRTWTGVSIELWRTLADELEVEYELRDFDLEGLIRAVETGQVDVAVAALTATVEREQAMDFTHSYYETGFGIAVSSAESDPWSEVLGQLGSPLFARMVGLLVLLLGVVALLVWVIERSADPSLGPFSALAMTALGRADTAPRTPGGRVLRVVWVFGAVVLLGSFFAAMAASLVSSRSEHTIQGPEDLEDARVGTVEGSTSERYLGDRGLESASFDLLEEALDALAAGEVDAVVYDEGLLRYLAARRPGVEVLESTFEDQSYAFAVPTASPLRESLNRALLSDAVQAEWKEILERYLGQGEEVPVKPPVDGPQSRSN